MISNHALYIASECFCFAIMISETASIVVRELRRRRSAKIR